jgi:uncharacterized MAPEG superfamily protein
MTPELTLLAFAILLGLLHIIAASHAASLQRGYRWTASSRAVTPAPLTGLAGRIERATRNYLETFPFFAAAVVLAHVANAHSWMTVTGAGLYVGGRILYFILYAADLPLARSLSWNIPTIGIVLITVAAFMTR